MELRTLDEWQALQAMRRFLDAFWERGGKQGAVIDVLSWTWSTEPGVTADPAMWEDWQDAVTAALESKEPF